MKITVYITSYNQKAYLKEAIDSVLSQTLKPFEIIIVDDFSTDGSREMILEYADNFAIIRYYFHEKNLGVTEVRRKALSLVKGDYVTYLDGDDIYLPNKLEVESRLLENGRYNLVFSNNMYVDPDNLNDVKWIWAVKKFELKSNIFIQTLTRQFPRKSLFRMELINYELLKSVGFHDSNLEIYEDYDLRIRLAQKAQVNFSIEPTTKIRISKNGLSKSGKDIHIKAYEYIYKKYSPEIDKLEDVEKASVLELLDKNLRSLGKPLSNKEQSGLTNSIKKKLKKLVKKN